jgi:hypothetical protein
MPLISLTQGKFARVDFCDFDRVNQFNWYAARYGRHGQLFYAQREENGTTIKMHRFIIGAPGIIVDHRDGDGLSNCRSNLRVASNQQNGGNRKKCITPKTSKFKGVYACRGKWRASIRLNWKLVHIGYYEDETEAARAYDAKARELFGEFACPNFRQQASK